MDGGPAAGRGDAGQQRDRRGPAGRGESRRLVQGAWRHCSSSMRFRRVGRVADRYRRTRRRFPDHFRRTRSAARRARARWCRAARPDDADAADPRRRPGKGHRGGHRERRRDRRFRRCGRGRMRRALRAQCGDSRRNARPASKRAMQAICAGCDHPRRGWRRGLPIRTFFSPAGSEGRNRQIAFDLEGIARSAGSACSSGKVGESHVLTAMGFDAEARRASRVASAIDDGRGHRSHRFAPLNGLSTRLRRSAVRLDRLERH